MPKQCRECQTVVDDCAPYCEACGCQFVRVPANSLTREKWQYISAAVALVVLGLAYFGLYR